MNMRSRLLLLAACAAHLGGVDWGQPRQAAPCIIFDGKAVAASALPETVAKPVREAAARLEPWAAKHRINLYVANNDPLVLGLPANFATTGQILSKLRQAREDYKKKFVEKIPDVSLELIYTDRKEALGSYVDLLVERESYLKGWAASAKESPGFWLLQPLASAYFRDPKDPAEKKAEFNLTNQLVHQFGHLLANATLGRLPYWVQESVAWNVEQNCENQIYAFCHRSGFVFKKEHAGWPALGRKYLVAGKTLPLDKIFPLERDSEIPKELGAGAMVLTEFLAASQREAWLKFTASLKADLEGKISEPGYRIAVARQKEYFESAFGKDAAANFVPRIAEMAARK
jgi:hypothetical protein